MPTMQMSIEGEPLETREFEGSWWFSTAPDVIALGTLSIDANSFGLLHLPTGLLPSEAVERGLVIHGTCGNKKLTLLRTARISWSGERLNSTQRATDEYWHTGIVIYGAHLDNLDSLEIRSFIFETEHLVDWLNKPFVSDSLDTRNPTLTTELPASIDISVEALGVLTIGWSTKHSHSGHTATIRITPEVSFTPTNRTGLSEFLNIVMQPFLNFTSFGLDHSDTSKNMRIDYLTDEGLTRVGVIFGGLTTNPRLQRIFPHEQILPFKKIESEPGTFIRNWFALSKQQEHAMREFFSIFRGDEAINERDFPRIVGALESWHSHWRPELTQIDQNTFDISKAQLIQGADEEMAKLLNDKLDNRPVLRTRLNHLIDESTDHIKDAVRIVGPKFVSRCIATRDGMVHVNPGKKVFTKVQKNYANQILVSLFSSLILKEIGVPYSDIDKRLDKESTRCNAIYAANYLDGELAAEAL